MFGPGSAAAAPSVTTVTSTAVSTLTVAGLAPASSVASTSAAIDAGQIYRGANASVVTVYGFVSQTYNTFYGPYTKIGQALGSGFVMTYNNADYIVTNFHVVDGVTNMTVVFWNGHAYPAAVVGTDPYSDLAIVKVPTAPASEFRPLALSSSSSVHVGDSVAAIGNPFGLSGSLTAGVISQLGRTVSETAAGNYSIAGVIQFSAPINPGNSGGPLFNVNGQVIGLTTATVSGSQGVGFAIPSDAVSREIGSLVANGSYSLHPYLGIGTADMFYQLARANGNNVTYGVLVESLVAGGPAANAGIKAGTNQATVEGQYHLLGGDVIVSINGIHVINHDALASYLEGKAVPGHTLVVGITRGTTPMSVTVTIGARPSTISTVTSAASTV
jgi:serine protease Do